MILDVHSPVTLVADVMFKNGIPFLVSSSRNINLITIEHAPQCTASKLGSLLQHIIRVYARTGFQIQTILMDNEFEKVRDHVPHANLNIPAASKHIGEIEHKIRVIKERSCVIVCTLPYARIIPHQMLLHLLHHIVMWLNNFLVSGGVSDRFSPRELILCHHLDYFHHCKALFGSYCETHEENTPTNSMQSRTMPAICLGPTGNMQGTYNFLNLATGLIVKRRCFHEIPAPDSVIKRVNDLATKNGVSSTLVFANRHKIPYDWPDNDAHQDGHDPTPLAPYPDIPAKIPWVALERHQPPSPPALQQSSTDHDWSRLADEAIVNADLHFEEHLPSPPEVIKITDNDEVSYSPPVNTLPLAKSELPLPPQVDPNVPLAPRCRPPHSLTA